MAYVEGPKFTGTTQIDLGPLKDDLVDLPPSALQGCRVEGEGLGDVLTELAKAMPNHGNEAEIHPASYQRVLDATTKIAAFRAKEIDLAKALEVCRESRARLENNREEDLSAIGTQAEKKAAKANLPGLLAHFEKTIAYKARVADKAAATRKKNAEEAAKKVTPA